MSGNDEWRSVVREWSIGGRVVMISEHQFVLNGMLLGQQEANEIIADPLLHVYSIPQPPGTVPLLRKEQQIVILVVGDEAIDEPGGVPEMDVLVNEAVHDHELPPHVRHVIQDCRVLVRVWIVLGRAHVALGVVGVVAVPGGDGGPRDGDLEDVRGATEAHGGEVPPVTPAVDADAFGIRDPLEGEPAHGGDLIEDLGVAESPVEALLEAEAAAGGAAVVALEDGKSEGAEALSAHVVGLGVGAVDALYVGSSVDGEDEGVGTRSVGFGVRAVEGGVELGGVVCGAEGEEFGGLEGVVVM